MYLYPVCTFSTFSPVQRGTPKICQDPLKFDFKLKGKIFLNFVCFSESPNFNAENRCSLNEVNIYDHTQICQFIRKNPTFDQGQKILD